MAGIGTDIKHKFSTRLALLSSYCLAITFESDFDAHFHWAGHVQRWDLHLSRKGDDLGKVVEYGGYSTDRFCYGKHSFYLGNDSYFKKVLAGLEKVSGVAPQTYLNAQATVKKEKGKKVEITFSIPASELKKVGEL